MRRSIWISFYIFFCLQHDCHAQWTEKVNPNKNPTVWDQARYRDYFFLPDRRRIQWLSEEIVIDTRVKQRQLQGMRNQFANRLPYECGIIMGRIREKYKRMNDIFREMLDRFRRRNQLTGPDVVFNKPLHYMIAMEQIKAIEMEIDGMVHVFEVIPQSAFDREFELLRDFIAGDKYKPSNTTATPPGGTYMTGPGGIPIYDTPPPPKGEFLREGSKVRNRQQGQEFATVPPFTRLEQNKEMPSFRSDKDLKAYYRDKFDAKKKGDKEENWLDHYYGFA